MNSKMIAAALLVMSALPAVAINGTLRPYSGEAKTGDIKWQSRAKQYVISFKQGKTEVSAEYPLADVMGLDIPKPAGLDKALAAAKSGQAASALPLLTKTVADYKMLVWDKVAARTLIEYYLKSGKTAEASKIADGILADDKDAAFSGAFAPAYWAIMLKQGKQEQLEKLLKRAVGTGDRASSAYALSMRGDIILAQGGDKPENCRKALTDGFLRVVLMYTDPECVEARAEAMVKAASCFDKIGMASRAEDLRAKAKEISK